LTKSEHQGAGTRAQAVEIALEFQKRAKTHKQQWARNPKKAPFFWLEPRAELVKTKPVVP
jgi:hypothetical protein